MRSLMVSLCHFRPRWLPAPRRRRRGVLALELLEPRAIPALFFVTTFGDAGPVDTGVGLDNSGDLRYCIIQARKNEEADIIQFAAPGAVTLNSALPDLADTLTLVGVGSGSSSVRRNTATGDFRLFNVLAS